MGYYDTHFRIRCRYGPNSGWPDREAERAFDEEVCRLFQEAGWNVQDNDTHGMCSIVTKGSQDLYIHPQDFSGVVAEEEVPKLKKLFEKAETFGCLTVDRYEEYLDLSDGEYQALLESKRDEITAVILETCRTKRKNLYVLGSVSLDIAQRFSVPRICNKVNWRYSAHPFVERLLMELLAEGRLVSAETKYGRGLRTVTEKTCKPAAKNLEGQMALYYLK